MGFNYVFINSYVALLSLTTSEVDTRNAHYSRK